MEEGLVFLLLAGLGWLWFGAMQAKEMAFKAAGQACERHGVLLLDQTVALKRISFKRDSHGRLRIRRRYAFEFDVGDETRREGFVQVQAGRVVELHLDLAQGTLYDLH